MAGAKFAARFFQCFGGLLAGPVGFNGALELALGANAGESQIMNRSHVNSPSHKIYSSDGYFDVESK